MPLYVVALTDTDLGAFTFKGRRIQFATYDGIHVAYERRTIVPPMTDDELRAQHALVTAIAERAPAVLPARFGSLVSKRDLTTSIRTHEPEIRAALDQVRDHVQMTVRVVGPRPRIRTAPSTSGISGRQYLERARRAAAVPTTADGERFLKADRPHIALERREPGAGQLLATIYHLVSAPELTRYRKAAGTPPSGVILSGPWPPFAFAPRLW